MGSLQSNALWRDITTWENHVRRKRGYADRARHWSLFRPVPFSRRVNCGSARKMKIVKLIHWNEAEAKIRTENIEALGYEVDFRPFSPSTWLELKQNPSDAVVIDLTRLPSQGRDVALGIRKAKTTRHIPIVFVDGDAEKVERIKKQLPDATYAKWNRISTALKTAIAKPVTKPIVPETQLGGYSGTPLPKKLGIKAGTVLALVGTPDDFEATLGTLPNDVTVRKNARGKRELTIWFVRSSNELDTRVDRFADQVGDGGLWIAWPKKASEPASDVTQKHVREIGLAAGLVDYKICSIDKTWSGLKFSLRKS